MTSVHFAPYLERQHKSFNPKPSTLPVVDLSLEFPKVDIKGLLSTVRFSVSKFLSSSGQEITAVEPQKNDKPLPQKEKELLKDFHGTFHLFSDSFDHAAELSSKGGENISVRTYISDLTHRDFIETLEEAKNNGANPSNIIIEILPDDHGVLNSVALYNLERLQSLGYKFAVHDFIENTNGEVDVQILDKITEREYLKPSFIHISEKIFSGLKQKVLKFSKKAGIVLAKLSKMGVDFVKSLIDEKTKEEDLLSNPPESIKKLIDEAVISKEGMINIDGITMATEGLVRFANGITVPEGLDILKNGGFTLLLLEKGIKSSVSDILLSEYRSINMYLKDLGHPSFRNIITKTTLNIKPSLRKFLILEVLEDKYGSLNRTVLDNLRWLKDQGYSLAIDDLFVGSHMGLSTDILNAFIEEDLFPDYVKIDGSHIEGIRTGKIDMIDLSHLRELVWQYISPKTNKRPIYVIEWVKDKAHALLVNETIGSDLVEFWYQGKDINPADF